MDEQRPEQDWHLDPRRDTREQAYGQHQAADEVGESDVVEQAGGDDPWEAHLLDQRLHEFRPGVGDDKQTAEKKSEPEIDTYAIEPDLGVGFCPVDPSMQLFHGNSLLWDFGDRSEEHTSELQSQSNLVCRL